MTNPFCFSREWYVEYRVVVITPSKWLEYFSNIQFCHYEATKIFRKSSKQSYSVKWIIYKSIRSWFTWNMSIAGNTNQKITLTEDKCFYVFKKEVSAIWIQLYFPFIVLFQWRQMKTYKRSFGLFFTTHINISFWSLNRSARIIVHQRSPKSAP